MNKTIGPFKHYLHRSMSEIRFPLLDGDNEMYYTQRYPMGFLSSLCTKPTGLSEAFDTCQGGNSPKQVKSPYAQSLTTEQVRIGSFASREV